MMNAELLIANADEMTDKMYMDAAQEDRLAFKIGLLQSRIREICYLYNNVAEELRRIQKDLED
jgi:hypothetical protein